MQMNLPDIILIERQIMNEYKQQIFNYSGKYIKFPELVKLVLKQFNVFVRDGQMNEVPIFFSEPIKKDDCPTRVVYVFDKNTNSYHYVGYIINHEFVLFDNHSKRFLIDAIRNFIWSVSSDIKSWSI